jgi:phosphonate transport system substrate-binding protein
MTKHMAANMTRTIVLLIVLLLSAPSAFAGPAPVRFGLTAAVVRDDIDLYARWAAYLGRKIGQPVEFVQRRSYREAIDLLQDKEVDFSWICSSPYVKYRDSNLFSLMAVPQFEGKPLYQSYIIVNKSDAAQSISDLKDRVFAYEDPDSNTGYVVPRQMVADLGFDPDGFFRRTFFTYSHREQVEAVAAHVADGAGVDSYVWHYLEKQAPQLTAATKIIQRSAKFGFPPLVYRLGIDEGLRQRMTNAFLGMDKDPEGRALLSELMLDGFISGNPHLYDDVPINVERR